MYIRSERKAWNIEGTYLIPGATMSIDQATLSKYQRLVDRGDLVVFERDPNAKKVAAKPTVEVPPEKEPKPKAKRKRSTKKKVTDA
jgi:hypothetical protein